MFEELLGVSEFIGDESRKLLN